MTICQTFVAVAINIEQFLSVELAIKLSPQKPPDDLRYPPVIETSGGSMSGYAWG